MLWTQANDAMKPLKGMSVTFNGFQESKIRLCAVNVRKQLLVHGWCMSAKLWDALWKLQGIQRAKVVRGDSHPSLMHCNLLCASVAQWMHAK